MLRTKLADEIVARLSELAEEKIGQLTENATLRHTRRSDPCVDGHFYRRWHRRGSDASVLTNEVHDAPAPVALLEVIERKRGYLRPPNATAQEHSQDRAVTQSADSRDIRSAQ